MTKYSLDTNVFVDSLRSGAAAELLKEFFAVHLPSTYLTAVVVQELRAGARTSEQVAALDAGIVVPFERRNRIILPSLKAFKESGQILADLAVKDKVDIRSLKPSFVNDVLIAASCREMGITLLTSDRDYSRIARHLKGFRFMPPPFGV